MPQGSNENNEKHQVLDQLVGDVLASSKYEDICPELINTIGAQEIGKRRSLKEALKATKNKLHQISGAYLSSPQYTAWLCELQQALHTGDHNEIEQVCKHILSYHTSTKERLPFLEQFYRTILADLAPISSMLDLACGFNPLAIPWMPLVPEIEYYAYDIHRDMINFLNAAMALLGIRGSARVCDVLESCPEHEVDVALILKTLPCLEQVDKQAGSRLLQAIHAKHVVISFPVRSLGGRSKGMARYYEARLHELLGGKAEWEVRKFEFATELVFVVTK